MRIVSCAVILSSITLFSASAGAETRLNAGTTRWARAANAGRTDLFFLGDSIVSYGDGGWSNGLARAAQDSGQLSGSGLLTAPYDLPFNWASYTGARIWSGPPTESIATGAPSLTPSGRHYEVGSNFAFLGTGSDALAINQTRPIDWHVIATGLSADAQLLATRTRHIRQSGASYVVQTSNLVPVQNSAHATDYVFHFDATPDPGDWTSFEFKSTSRDTALYYTKLVDPTAKGFNVSGWGEGGGTAASFRNQYYNDARFTPGARTALYQSLVAGNSGLLNVAITFGVNDASQFTPAQFKSSVENLIADVRRDWAAAQMPADNLSFTLVSAYQVNRDIVGAQTFQNLSDFRGSLDAIASTDPAISFIDIWQAGPTWQQAVANGYLADRVHPSAAGTRVYGKLLLDQLMPRMGDADIDGDVDFDDLYALIQHYGDPSTSWRHGDFDGINGTAFDDLVKLAQNYQSPFEDGSFEADLALARSLAPEPTLGLTAGFTLLLCRRRRADATER